MSLLYPPSLSVPFGRDAVSPYIRVVPVLPPVEPGAASWETGFVPANMTVITSGGIPPFGSDMNGVINTLSANVVWAVAGLSFVFNPDIVTNAGGYPRGSILVNPDFPSEFFYSLVDDNVTDPSDDLTDWLVFSPLSTPVDTVSVAPTAGTHNNFAVAGGVGALDVDTTAGNITLTGITPTVDGHILVVSNTGPNVLTLAALNGGSTADVQFRLPADLSILQNDSLTLRYFVRLTKWLRI